MIDDYEPAWHRAWQFFVWAEDKGFSEFAVLLGRNIYGNNVQFNARQYSGMAKEKYFKDLKKFGRRLVQLRTMKDLSQRDLSYACEIDNSKISKIEQGKINVTFTTIVQLAEALEVSVSELMDYESA